jgi:hypothetical protein
MMVPLRKVVVRFPVPYKPKPDNSGRWDWDFLLLAVPITILRAHIETYEGGGTSSKWNRQSPQIHRNVVRKRGVQFPQ